MTDNEDVLVTGGAGFIGSWFCNALLDSNSRARVICLDKLTYCTSSKTVDVLRNQYAKRFVLVQADIADSAVFMQLAEQFPHIKCVVHFAAESFVDKSFLQPSVFVESNIVGTLNVLEYAKKQALSKVLHISTDEVYGEALNCTEDAAMGPTNPYAATKASAEMLVHSYYKSWRIPVTTVRCSNVYGPRQYPEKIIPLFCKALMSTPPKPCCIHGKGINKRRYLYASDAADAMLLILHKGEPGSAYNVGAGVESELENRQVLYTLIDLAKLSHYRDQLVCFGDDRVYNDSQYSMNCDKIAALGWKPRVHLYTGLRTCLEWERDNRDWFATKNIMA